MSHDVRGKLH